MYQIIQAVYTGESLVTDSLKKSFIDTIPQNALFYLLFFLLIIFLFYVLFVFILPLSKKNPEKLFQEYKDVRKKVEDVDELYNNKKLSYDEYVSLQWESAKEYERLIVVLSKFPDYKKKLESYSLVTASSKEIVDATKNEQKLSEEEKEKQTKIDSLYKLLLPRAKYFSEDEIKLALRDEGYKREVIIGVVQKMKNSGIVFGAEVELKTNKIADFVNTLFASRTQNINIDNEIIETNKKNIEEEKKKLPNRQDAINKKADVVIDIRETIKSAKDKPSTKITPKMDLSKVEEKKVIKIKRKGGIIAAFKVLFSKKKPDTHSVDEINDIFKDIEKSLKNKN